FAVALLSRDGDGVAAAEEFGQIDLESANVAHRCPGDGGSFVIWKHDRMLGTDPAARRTAAFAIVLVFHGDALEAVHAVDAEQAEIDALHAIGAATVIDDRVPTAIRWLQNLLG